jgi:N-ethylmaleimide reductase
VIEAVAGSIGIERTGIRFSPNIASQGVDDSDPAVLFTALAIRLEQLKVPWIELREAHQRTLAGAIPTAPVSPAMRPLYSGKIIVNSDYDGPSGQARLDEGIVDGIAFGRAFLANPDLVERIRRQAPLNQPDSSSFYWGGAEGYVDYPALPDARAA